MMDNCFYQINFSNIRYFKKSLYALLQGHGKCVGHGCTFIRFICETYRTWLVSLIIFTSECFLGRLTAMGQMA